MLWFVGWTYLFYIVPASIGVLILRRHALRQSHWSPWELNILVVPYLIWTLLMFLDDGSNKNHGNLLEPVVFGFEVIVLAAVRIKLWSYFEVRSAGIAMSLFLVLSALLIFWLTPEFPEVL